MKNSNLTAKIAGLIILLVAVVGVLVIWTNYTVTQNVVACYVARTDVDSYTVITNTNFNEYFEESTVHKTTYEKLKNPVSSKDEILGYETISKIAQGYPLDKSLFQKTSNAKYEGIENPVIQAFSIANGDEIELTKGMSVTIIGYMASTESVLDKEGLGVRDSWIGVLTNNALIYDFAYDKNGKLLDVTFIIEEKILTKLAMFSLNYNLYLVGGKIDNVADAKSDIVRDLYLKSGSNSDLGFAITNVDLYFDVKEVINNQPTYFATGADTNYKNPGTKQKLTYVSPVDNILPEITWTGATPSVYVYHFAIDGSRGSRYGNYSKTSNNPKFQIVYDEVFNEYKFKEPLADEGFYQIIYDVKNPNYGNEYIDSTGLVVAEPYYLHYCVNFVIETSDKKFEKTPTLIIDSLNENTVHETLSSVKNYFKNVFLMKDYEEKFELDPKTDERISMRFISYTDESGQSFRIPYFTKNEGKTEGLTPNNEQILLLQTKFGQVGGSNLLSDSMIASIFGNSTNGYYYSKEDIDFILKHLPENFDTYSEYAKKLVLISLGYDAGNADVTNIINGILTPKVGENENITYAKFVLVYENNKEIEIKIDVNK